MSTIQQLSAKLTRLEGLLRSPTHPIDLAQIATGSGTLSARLPMSREFRQIVVLIDGASPTQETAEGDVSKDEDRAIKPTRSRTVDPKTDAAIGVKFHAVHEDNLVLVLQGRMSHGNILALPICPKVMQIEIEASASQQWTVLGY